MFKNYNQIILGVIVAAFILQMFSDSFTQTFMLNPADFQFWMFVTPIFLHSGFMHLFFNGYAILMFGSYLERKIGSDDYLKLFFICGIAGNVLYMATVLAGIAPPIPALGASGAVYGILGALAILQPNMVLLIFGVFPMKIRHAAVLWIFLEFFGSFNPGSGIASAAHLGGLLIGIGMAKFYEKKNYVDAHYWIKKRH